MTVSADSPCWLRLLVSESMWSVVRLESSCSSAVWLAPPKLSWSTEARAHVSGGKLKSADKHTCSLSTSFKTQYWFVSLNFTWTTYFQTCCHTEKHWRNLIGCQSLWGRFHWRWLGRSTQRAHRGRLQDAWRSDGSGALVDLWGSPDFLGYCHASSCPKKNIGKP